MSLKKFLKAAKDHEEQSYRARDEESFHADHDESNWLVSYADMMTLLCGFFIMMFSMAHLDEPKFEQVKESLAKQFGGKYEAPSNQLAKFVTQVINEAGIEKTTSVKYDGRGVAVTFQSTVFFDSLSADVRGEGTRILERLIESVAQRQAIEHKNYRIVVEGHTDSRPVVGGSFASNWELAGGRASRVVRMFLDHGFAPDRLTSISYADTHPEAEPRLPNGTWDETALAKNRRVVIRILEPEMDSIPFPPEVAKPEMAQTQPSATAAGTPPAGVETAPGAATEALVAAPATTTASAAPTTTATAALTAEPTTTAVPSTVAVPVNSAEPSNRAPAAPQAPQLTRELMDTLPVSAGQQTLPSAAPVGPPPAPSGAVSSAH